MATEDAKNTPSQEQMPDKGRRDTLKTLATVPILGALAYGVYQKRKDALRGRNISDVFQVSNRQASYLEPQEDPYRFGRLRYSWKAIDACRRFR